MNALFTGIYSAFTAGAPGSPTALYTALSGRMYLKKAPQEATFPYVVYDLITAIDELDFTDENETFILQFDIFTQNNSASSAGSILGNLKTLYDDCSLTVVGYRHLYMTRDSVIPNDDIKQVPPIMGYSVQYECQLEKVRS